ncbi:MAG: NADH-quinone oxidoreductase subunit NuoN [Rickettsiales bacterium]
MIYEMAKLGIEAIKPELFLLFSAVFLLLYGLYRKRTIHDVFVSLSLMVLVLTGYMALCSNVTSGTFINGMFTHNGFTQFSKALVLLAGGLSLMLSSDFLKEDGGRPFEFVILILLSLLGMMLMVSAANLLALYMALEMSSLSLYVLASFLRDDDRSSEAGLKYFILGSLASGMMLFGISLVYGFAGTISFSALAELFASQQGITPAIIVGLILLIVGFCFKLSAVPFHMWTPDVYEGAPTPVTAFFATAPKIAAFILFIRLLFEPFASSVDSWRQVIIFISISSMLVGAFGGIAQNNIKRMLAYSSIGHVGFMFMAIAAGGQDGVQSVLIYLCIYVFMSIGMFAGVMLMKRGGKALENISDLGGLAQTSPTLAIAISIFIFSMAGIPPLAGFFGKWYVILAAVKGGLSYLAIIGVITSVISCYYYLRIVKIMYFDKAEDSFDKSRDFLLKLAILISSMFILLFFLMPTKLIVVTESAAVALLK